MALVIAALGIANTLAMSVLERRKEIGTLRALGLDRAGVTRMIRLEALLIGGLGATLGTVMGVFLGWRSGAPSRRPSRLHVGPPLGRLALGVLIAWPGRCSPRSGRPAEPRASTSRRDGGAVSFAHRPRLRFRYRPTSQPVPEAGLLRAPSASATSPRSASTTAGSGCGASARARRGPPVRDAGCRPARRGRRGR
ncbi:ABC transporter permease [Streptomyces sp. RKAG337]|uniref:ABC transporter permease n=1 Tax=Streptomyces sp. RKAG337 TaxID=2893404 RepID=UPI0035A91DEF